MLLHNDTELFLRAINLAAQRSGYSGAIVEKDYYVTLLLFLNAKFFMEIR